MQERERDKGEGEVLCDEASGARKAELPNVVMLKQEISGSLSPVGKLCLVVLEVPDPLPRRGQAPHWVPQNSLPSRVLGLLNQ